MTAYQFYCGKSLENAHSAKQNTLATFEVLDAQIEKYADLPNDIAALSEFSFHNKFADLAGLSPLMIKMKKFSLSENTKVKKWKMSSQKM